MNDPVHRFKGEWYFYDETGERTGPYETKEKARIGLRQYVESI